jgi:hypothetical protein
MIYRDGKFPDVLEMPMKNGYQEPVLDKDAKNSRKVLYFI